MPTRQTSSSGRPKSPRIQVVLPEELCQRLALLAEEESRTLSNMAKVLIQQGVERLEQERSRAAGPTQANRFRAELERRETGGLRNGLSRPPRRLRLRPPAG